MLTELHIENFAIIDRLNIVFNGGLTTFTGETGAGKSIIIDAVETILGGRADSTMVRTGSERADIEAIFRLSEQVKAPVQAILEREELVDEETDEYVILSREIRLNGRNVARVNGRVANLSLLREVGEYLVDLHGQSEHLSLLKVSRHQDMLDSFAAADPQLSFDQVFNAYRQTYNRLQSVRRELKQLRQTEKDSARRSDLLDYQINEIEAARLRPEEEEQLLEERNRLANAENLASLTQEALIALDEGTPDSPATTDLVGQIVDAIEHLSRIDASQAPLYEQVQDISERLSELAKSLRIYLEEVEFNPKRLDYLEDRLALIYNLKKKYGPTIPAILEFLENARQELDSITHAGERIEELEKERDDLLSTLGKQGQRLSRERHTAAENLSAAIETELADLYMSGAKFTVDFQVRLDPEGALLADGRRVAYDASGLERVEFLIAPNLGEGFKPLAKIASGGETSRLMLAMKNVLAKADQISTLIFDEIDQGIGGRVGAIVGSKLWNLARQHQVLCITHLPQLAAFGEQHFKVEKKIQGDRTITYVQKLEGESRLRELALMLGEVSEGTLHSARELLQTVGTRIAGAQ
ncbi:MAG: DNA repair protein RecN [Anaerolineales bacterium]|jgi:DNA repair protein RecN (Recombination protein N)